MKKLFTLLFSLLTFSSLFSQAPNSFSYQAIVRDANQNLITNRSIGIRISILQGSASGTLVFLETHSTLSNDNGLISIEIGNGAISLGAINNINWSSSAYFIKSEYDLTGGSNYSLMSTTKLQSVPYSIYSNIANNISGVIDIQNGGTGAANVINAKTNLNLQFVDNTSDSLKPISNATQAALNLKLSKSDTASLSARINTKAAINSPSFTGTVTGVTKSMVGLGNADNTSDSLKPISNATQAALNLKLAKADTAGLSARINTKAAINNPSFTGTVTGVTKSMVGLGNADNTSDSLKPISNATQAALNLKLSKSDTASLSARIDTKLSSTANNITIRDLGGNSILIGRGKNPNFGKLAFGNNAGAGQGSNSTAIGDYSLTNNTTGNYNTTLGYNTLLSNTTGSHNIAVGGRALSSNTTGSYNIAFGEDALKQNLTGTYNIAIGFESLMASSGIGYNTAIGNYALRLNSSGVSNIAIGLSASDYNTSGSFNVVVGHGAMFVNTAGSENVAIGAQALGNNTVSELTAVGYDAMRNNTIGIQNTAVGYKTLFKNTTGSANTALGWAALYSNTTGVNNTALGQRSMELNTTGNENMAIGILSLRSNTTGSHNYAIGNTALFSTTTGNGNIALNKDALYNNTTGSNNTGIGFQAIYANTTGERNIGFGTQTLMANTIGNDNINIGFQSNVGANNLSNAIAIGNFAVVNASNTIQLGNASITNIYTNGSMNATAFNVTSDRRLKTNIIPITNAVDKIMKLDPVSYSKKSSISSNEYKINEMGFVAQEIQKVLPDIIKVDDTEQKILSVNYVELIPLLTKALQEQQLKIQELEKVVAELKKK